MTQPPSSTGGLAGGLSQPRRAPKPYDPTLGELSRLLKAQGFLEASKEVLMRPWNFDPGSALAAWKLYLTTKTFTLGTLT